MIRLTDDIISIKGIGEKTAKLFYKMNIYSVEDLLLNLPKGFTCYEEPVCPKDEDNGMITSIPAVPISGSIVSKKTGRYTISLAKVKSMDKVVSVRFFNMPYIRNLLKPGQSYILRGVLTVQKEQSKNLQQEMVKHYAGYREDIERAFSNAAERG